MPRNTLMALCVKLKKEEANMPNIGGKKFPYTPAGIAAANRYARQTGQSMNNGGGGR